MGNRAYHSSRAKDAILTFRRRDNLRPTKEEVRCFFRDCRKLLGYWQRGRDGAPFSMRAFCDNCKSRSV